MDVTFDSTVSGSSSTSYLTLDDAKQRMFDRNYNYGELSDNDFKRALNKATAYIDSTFSSLFGGYRTEDTQTLAFPREGCYYVIDPYEIDSGTIPPEIKNAVVEATYLLITGTDLTATISKSGKLKKSKEKVDVIETEYEYEDGSTLYTDIYVAVNKALTRLTGGTAANNILKIYRVGGESA